LRSKSLSWYSLFVAYFFNFGGGSGIIYGSDNYDFDFLFFTVGVDDSHDCKRKQKNKGKRTYKYGIKSMHAVIRQYNCRYITAVRKRRLNEFAFFPAIYCGFFIAVNMILQSVYVL